MKEVTEIEARMAGMVDVLIYASFLFTPLSGLLVIQLLLRSGLFTAGTTERKVPLFSIKADYFVFKSQVHKWLVMAGFFIGWFVGTGVYVYLLDQLYFN